MSNEEAIDIIKNEMLCVESNCDRDCSSCSLVKDENDILDSFGKAITALEENQKLKAMVDELADCLDGCPLKIPCDFLLIPKGWCAKNCKSKEPSKECWIKYAEVMASG